MKHTIILAMLLAVAMPAHAGFKFYGKGGQTMTSTETEQEAERRANKDQNRQQYIDGVRANTAAIATPQKKRSTAICPPQQPCPVPAKDGGAAPGGHRRHEWREKTGFNTPAERTRYRRAVWEEQERARKEKARPNPGGAHPEEIRKQHMPKF